MIGANEAATSLQWTKFPVLDDGFVTLVDVMGDDQTVVQAARVSYGEGTKTVSDDRTLIRYLLRHRHCYHPEMEVLTSDGWKKWKDCNFTETFLVPNPENRTLKPETIPLEVFDAQEAMQTFKSGRMSYCVTGDHRMWFMGKYQKHYKIHRAAEMPHWGHFDPKSGYAVEGIECEPSVIGKLIGFILGDGSWSGNGISFHLRKERKKKFLREILSELGKQATESQSSTYEDATVFYVSAETVRELKILEWIDQGDRVSGKHLKKIPSDPGMAKGVFIGLTESDGYINEDRNERIEYSSISKELSKDFEALASMCGYDAHHVSKEGEMNVVIAYPSGRTTLEAREQYFGTEWYCGKVFCATTSTGLLMVRGNCNEFGFVCGNTTPFEMAEIKLLVRVPMDCWRQWIRHRAACLAGDTPLVFERPVDGVAYRLTVKDVFDRFQPTENTQRPDKQRNPYFKRERVQSMRIRCLNESTGEIGTTSVVDIWESGEKALFKLEIEGGRSIRCSKDHRIHTPSGWKTLEQLSVGDSVSTISRRVGVVPPVPNIVDDTEEWVPLKNWEGWYEISSQGRVRRIVGGKGSRSHGRCKQVTITDGRAVTSLNRPGEQVVVLIHRAMLESFGVAPEDSSQTEVCHRNGNSLDNRLENLRWGTSAENSADMIAHGTSTYLTHQPKRIVSISPDGFEMTYDLEVYGPWHNFSANDIVVHNSVNEYSTRYSEAIDARQTTQPDEWRMQAKSNRQGSEGAVTEWPEGFTVCERTGGLTVYEGDVCIHDNIDPRYTCGIDKWTPAAYLSWVESTCHDMATTVYRERLKFQVAREQARKDLPLSTYTEAYWKIDLHNLLHFLALRMDKHAQKEIREYATIIGEKIVAPLFPLVWEAFNDYHPMRNALLLSALDVATIQRLAGCRVGFPLSRAACYPETAEQQSVVFRSLPVEWQGSYLKHKRCRELDEFVEKAYALGLIDGEPGT